MMQSNFVGLITLLAEPKGLTILHNTGRSSTPETARKRYISTTLHMLSWYEIDLSPGSKSWASLNRVRKMHKNASNRSEKSKTGIISQTEIALTTFGFMGYALVRPHLLGIKYDRIPGYQFNVDMEKEIICRRIYSLGELHDFKKQFTDVEGYEYIENAIFDEKVMLYNVVQVSDITVNEATLANGTVTGVYNELNEDGNKKKAALEDLLQLKHNEQLVITTVEDESEWKSYLNDSKLKQLSSKDLGYFKFKCRLSESCYSKIGNFINESVLSLMLYRMRKAHV
ncbi:hypothetical protein pipiens_000016, partial [Culex pipiens pipiens]